MVPYRGDNSYHSVEEMAWRIFMAEDMGYTTPMHHFAGK